MSFGVLTPSVKNLLSQINAWSALNTYTPKLGYGATATPIAKFVNPYEATVSIQQSSPSIEWEGRGFRSSTAPTSQPVKFNSWVLPVQGTSNPTAIFKMQRSISGAAFSDLLDLYTSNPDGNTGGLLKFQGSQELSFSQSNADPNTSKAFQFTNVSGAYTNTNYKFASTVKAALTVDNSGSVTWKSINGQIYNFNFGADVTSTSLMFQIYSGGVYNNGGSFNSGKGSFGQASTSPPGTLSTFGSFAGKGSLTTSATYSIAESDFVIYGDPANAFLCSGTPSVTTCSSYTGSGQATCESHLPCVWNAGTSCSLYTGIDQATCETGHSGCTWASATCDGANNTDQATCEAQDDAYGGSCGWDTSTCGSQTTTVDCNNISGCSVSTSDCGGLSDGGGDGTNCATQSECSYDSGSGTCSGSYFASCSGSLCTGNYYTGNCSGTWGIACEGTVLCSSYSSSGPCSGEAGCSPATGSTWTLPLSTAANNGNTSRFHYLKHVGASGTINVLAGAGDTLESAIALTAGQAALVHHYTRTNNCSEFLTQSPCEAQSPCVWIPAVVCSSYDGNESGCLSAGCAWDSGMSTCSGAGTSATCSGTYTASKKWYKHATI